MVLIFTHVMGLVCVTSVLILTSTRAEIHPLVAANRYSPEQLHLIEFDDEADTLSLVRTVEAKNTHVWMSLKHDGQTLYGSSMENGRLVSYNSSSLEATGVIETSGACRGKNSAFNIPSPRHPYPVFSGSHGKYPGCAMSFSTQGDGSLAGHIDSWPYETTSSAHGLALHETDGRQLLYTADMGTDSIWIHSVDRFGSPTLVSQVKLPWPGSKPRHLIVHPQGTFSYVILEIDNSLLAMELDKSGFPITDVELAPSSLIPEGSVNSRYWSAGVSLSPNNRYLWTTTRGRNGTTGYVSCFLLDSRGELVKRMFTVSSGTAGTISSAISAAPWSSEYAVVSDAPGGYVEVWKLEDPKQSDIGIEYNAGSPVARLDIQSCCGHALWLS